MLSSLAGEEAQRRAKAAGLFHRGHELTKRNRECFACLHSRRMQCSQQLVRGGIGRCIAKSNISTVRNFANERYDGGPLTSACTLHANCASHPQLSYFWLSRTDQDGAATTTHFLKKRRHGEDIADGELVLWTHLLLCFCLTARLTHPV